MDRARAGFTGRRAVEAEGPTGPSCTSHGRQLTDACTCCRIADELAAKGRLFRAGEYWSCNERTGHQRPGLIIQTRIHREDFGDLSAEERSALGAVITNAVMAVRRHGSVERVYVLLYNEGRPGHVHFHVVPRFSGEVGPMGPTLADVMPEGAVFDGAAAVSEVSAALEGGRAEPSALVRAVRRTASTWDSRLSLYRFVPQSRWLDRAELYVGGWLAVWLGLLASSMAVQVMWLAVIIGIVAAYRAVDIGLYEIGILLKMERSTLRSVPRSLVLKAANLVEVTVACSAFLIAVGTARRSALISGFRSAALQPDFDQATLPGVVAVGLAYSLALLIVAGGVAMLIGKVADTFDESP